MAKNNVITKEEVLSPMVLNQKPAWLEEKVTSPRGMEEVTSKDIIIPRLELIQALSPARDKTSAAYIEGAEEGSLFNSVTRRLYGSEVLLVPVVYKKQWLVWKDRKQGGGTNGFRGAFDSDQAAKAEIERLSQTEQGLEMVETAQHFCILLGRSGEMEEIVLSMAKTKLKVSRRWNSLMRMAEGDSFSRVYKVSSLVETNARNEKFFNLNIVSAGYAPQAVYLKAESMYNQIRGGGVVISQDYEPSTTEVVQEEF